ncbi:MAG TPA: DAK2 domain-containing protein [Candidatus Dormibacteraeota bacterium]|nr:DAK2 domain-containing protein [Candidatus Dormibacteraeota bacterium]
MGAAEREAAGGGPGVVTTGHQPLLEVGGRQMMAGLSSALAWLQANQEVVNDLNVFPVPDGDTGSNMYLTLRSAVEDAAKASDPLSAAVVMQAAAHGSLMGARGNSGVILSQVFRGFGQGLQGRARVDAGGVAAALGEASAVAYKAVMKPTEGTILTVVREAAAAARRAAEGSNDIRLVLETAVREAHAAVERTPEQLAVLRDAGVVDAGGLGFAVVLEGFARALDGDLRETEETLAALTQPRRVGEPQLRRPGGRPAASGAPAVPGDRRGAAAVAERSEGWGYCTEFLIGGPGLDVDALREELGSLGESSLVVGDPDLVRVHIHTDDPAALITRAAERGRLSKLKVEDMSSQHHDILERAAAEEALRPPAPRKALGVVSVAPGEGFRAILSGLGADGIVEGGQTMNPSIESLLNAVRAANADSVIILPNNGNVILTALQVDALAPDVTVRVVPTRSLPQGITALLALDPGGDVAANCDRMEEAIAGVTTVEVTHAVRDSTADGQDIHAGDVIAVVDDRITQVGQDHLSVVEAVLEDAGREPELVTVYRGAGVDDDAATTLVEALRRRHPDVEFEVHDGGQDHYPYILSLE